MNILGAIAIQIGKQKDAAFGLLQEYYDELHPRQGLERSPDADDLRRLINTMSELFTQVLVVVDGLDECGDSTKRTSDSTLQQKWSTVLEVDN